MTPKKLLVELLVGAQVDVLIFRGPVVQVTELLTDHFVAKDPSLQLC